MKHKIVCVVGLGYVGLPLAEAFSKHLKVIGFNIDEEKTTNENPVKHIAIDVLRFVKPAMDKVKSL